MNLNVQIFHDFFYSEKREKSGKSATSYRGDHFFSYSTEIGMLYTRRKGRGPVLLVSDGYFSATTSSHIRALRNACPFERVEVPFKIWDDFRRSTQRDSVNKLKARFLSQLKAYAVDSFTRAQVRDAFNTKLRNFREFLDFTGQRIRKIDSSILETLESAAADTPESKAKRLLLAKEKAEKIRRENEEKRKEIANFIKENKLETLARKAEFVYSKDFTEKRRIFYRETQILKDLLAQEYTGFSFIWLNKNGDVETSQQVTVENRIAQMAFKAFKAKRLKPGMHIKSFVIREIKAKFLQIGCHKLAMQNITELASVL